MQTVPKFEVDAAAALLGSGPVILKQDNVHAGNGLRVVTTEEELRREVKSGSWHLAQKVLDPLLVRPEPCKETFDCEPVYKFKVRFFALVTSVDPLRVYVHHSSALAFLCSTPYAEGGRASTVCNRASAVGAKKNRRG